MLVVRNSRAWCLVSAACGSLRVRLLGLVFLALVPTLGLMLYTASEQRQRAVTEVQANAMRLTRLVAVDQEFYIEGARTLLITLARLPEVQSAHTVACSALFADLLKQYPQYANLGAAKMNGDVFCSGQPLTGLVNIADRSVFQRTVQTRDFAISEYQIGRITGIPLITLAYPIIDETRQVTGVVFVGLDLTWFNRLAIEVQLPLGSTLRVIDRNGTILARYPDPEKLVGQSMPEATIVKTILSQREGVADAPGIDGVPRLYAFMPLTAGANADAYVSIGIPKEIAFAEADWILARNLVALGLVAVLALAAAWIGGDLFVFRQVDALLSVTKRLSAGDLSARTGLHYGVGELSQLSHTFDQMVEMLEQRETERDQAEEQIRRQAARAESLVRVASRFNAQLDLESVLNAISEETVSALNVPAASVSLYDESRDVLCYATDCGLLPEHRERMQPIPYDIHEQCAQQMDPIIVVPDTLDSPGPPNVDSYAALNIRTVVGVRMLREGQLVGVLSLLTFGETRHFTEDELELLKGLANQAAQAITNARLHDELQREERAHACLLHQVITAQEDERMRIARELHDDTGQSLAALILGLDVAREILKEGSQGVEAHLRDVKAIAEGILQNTRRIIADLRPSLLDDLGLKPAIAWYGEQRLNPLGMTLQLKGDELQGRLPRSMETELFRIVQEAITNVIRHAHASMVSVNLVRQDGCLTLEIADDGCGFDPQTSHSNYLDGKGLGLRGMQERASMLGGEFHLQAMPGEGTRVTVRVPIPEGEVPDG